MPKAIVAHFISIGDAPSTLKSDSVIDFNVLEGFNDSTAILPPDARLELNMKEAIRKAFGRYIEGDTKLALLWNLTEGMAQRTYFVDLPEENQVRLAKALDENTCRSRDIPTVLVLVFENQELEPLNMRLWKLAVTWATELWDEEVRTHFVHDCILAVLGEILSILVMRLFIVYARHIFPKKGLGTFP